ncbi:MAG: AraC family transcriptional regulator [Chryseobacterium sp.]|uniref:helix-turn-helix domain-containing protein n=1 Tax=Epilithonimonas caeni TaxID=365343 RepID=UPI00041A5752|nr:helix-turn-helix domain-containing protein [Epilithonimonas caeni]MPS71946.1 AraC family transcriptional regulator [Chryseobacterium sp.]
MFYLAGIFIACFSSFLILGKKQKTSADYILALWFWIIGINTIYFLLIFSGEYVRFPFFLGLEIPLPLLHGPMLYLYVRDLTGQSKKGYTWILHFLPPILIYIILIPFFCLTSEEKKIVYENGGSSYKYLRRDIGILIIISGIFYVLASFISVKKYKKEIAQRYSNTDKINLNWLNYLIIGISLIWVAVLLKNDIAIFTMVVVFILLASYFGISKVGILNSKDITVANVENETNREPMSDPVIVKYQKSNASDESIKNVYQKLLSKIDNDKVFKDPELTLNNLAIILDVHPNLLSQTINQMENKNFYDYINRQRIEEFKRIALLPENQKYTILSLAFESGFNSKTSFNRNFKKYMDCSPREFLKSQNISLE